MSKLPKRANTSFFGVARIKGTAYLFVALLS